jgi:hypothetical protein
VPQGLGAQADGVHAIAPMRSLSLPLNDSTEPFSHRHNVETDSLATTTLAFKGCEHGRGERPGA